MRRTSPLRRRTSLLCVATFVVSLAWAVPGPRSGVAAIPRTVERTVSISLEGFAPADGPSLIGVAGGELRVRSALRTAPRLVCSSIWSTMVAFAWQQDGAGTVATTVDAMSGEHVAILQDRDADPDHDGPEFHPGLRTSPLYWTRGARCVRFAMRLPGGGAISDLRADFINTSGTSTGPGTGPPPASPGGITGGAFAMGSASAMTERPAMVTRAEWGAVKPRRHCLGYAPEIRMAYVHHTSGSNGYSRAQSDDIVRGIQYFHEFTRGYCDIAYNFLVDKYGTIYVGRYNSDNVSVNVVPGSQMGFNTYTFSVSAMGNYQSRQPSAATIDAIERILAWRLDVAHLPPTGEATMTSSGGATTRYRDGKTVTLPLISGHRQTGITDCPGNHIWSRLDAIRHAVFSLGGPKIFRPAASREAIRPITESDTFTAHGSQPMQWQVDIADESGNVVRSLYAERAVALSIEWDGTDDDGLPVEPGTYTATIWGQTQDARTARSATLQVAVNPMPVLPTPTPTLPVPSPSPS